MAVEAFTVSAYTVGNIDRSISFYDSLVNRVGPLVGMHMPCRARLGGCPSLIVLSGERTL